MWGLLKSKSGYNTVNPFKVLALANSFCENLQHRYLTESLIASGFKKGSVQWTKIKLKLALSFLRKNKRNYCSKSWNYEQIKTQNLYRSILSKEFLGKGVLKICSKLTREHPSQSVIQKMLPCNFVETRLRHSSVSLLHIFRTPFLQKPPDDCFSL